MLSITSSNKWIRVKRGIVYDSGNWAASAQVFCLTIVQQLCTKMLRVWPPFYRIMLHDVRTCCVELDSSQILAQHFGTISGVASFDHLQACNMVLLGMRTRRSWRQIWTKNGRRTKSRCIDSREIGTAWPVWSSVLTTSRNYTAWCCDKMFRPFDQSLPNMYL